jgi:dsRNA-specific ribonuclease
MLDRPKPQQRDPFDEWWDTIKQDGMDLRVAKLAFRAGYAAGCKKHLRRFVFQVATMRITVWATGVGEARKLAKKKAEQRATAKDWKSLPADLELVE